MKMDPGLVHYLTTINDMSGSTSVQEGVSCICCFISGACLLLSRRPTGSSYADPRFAERPA